MASLIQRGVLVDFAAQAPSPSKDYCQIYVTLKEFIFRWWKISPRNDGKIPPVEVKNSYADFNYDERVHSEVHRVFGKSMLDYLKRLCNGQIDYFPRLPEKLLLQIMLYLDLEDISRLSQVSKQFRELCNSDDLWRQIYVANSEAPVTEELEKLANEQGWKKLFFTNKIQLQMQLRRRRRAEGENIQAKDSAGLAFITESGDN